MSRNTKWIDDFRQAWSRLDPVELAAYCTEEGIDHNLPASGPQQHRRA